jgi:hypothetical protein
MHTAGGAIGGVRAVLRLEGAVMLLVSLALYQRLGGSWETFALCFLLPDVSFAGYARPEGRSVRLQLRAFLCRATALRGRRRADRRAHLPDRSADLVCPCWIRPRTGYGLKYSEGFGFTHLGRIGREARPVPARS